MATPRRRRLRRWLGALAVVLLVALPTSAFAVQERAATPSDPAPSLVGPGVLLAPAFAPGPGIVPLGPLPPTTPLHVIVALALSDPGALDAEIALEYTPGSAQYRHYLTPEEIARDFGPSQSAYEQAVGYFESEGLSVQTSPDRTLLMVGGPAGQVGQAFATTFEEYARGSGWFYSHPVPARLPSGIPWAGAIGLGNSSVIEPLALPEVPTPSVPAPSGAAPAAPNCQPSSWGVSPCEARFAYNLSGFVNSGINGSGYRIGIVDTYDAAESQKSLASDLAAFDSLYDLPYGNVSWLYPVPSGNLNHTYTIWGTEEALDLEWSRALAPGASIDMAFAPDSTYGLYAAVDYLVAHHGVDVLTMSWGENDVGIYNAVSGPCPYECNASSDGSYGILHPVLEAAAAEGISVFAASGDCGAAAGTSGVSTNYPASDPYVTGVGGTDLTLNSSGAWLAERGWSGNSSGASGGGCDNQGGSGGGWSPFPRPSWQAGPNLTKGPDLRGEPDVAALAGSPGVPIVLGGNNGSSGGTSAASPMWAGLAAVADQEAGEPLGFLNPALYDVAGSPSYDQAFHDITSGWNGYFAGPGWDPVTGLGSPNAAALIPMLSATATTEPAITVNLTASPRFGAAPLTVSFRANATGGTRPYSFFDITFGDGNSTSTTSGLATHRFTLDGVYSADAVVFDHASNSSVSVPVAIVVGGGGSLLVSLNATPGGPAVGATVRFTTTVAGGRAPYSYRYAFGDGTFADSNRSSLTHAYDEAGGYCAVVVVGDSHSPPDGAASPSVGIGVGGVAPPNCTTSEPLRASLSLSEGAADLPGDLGMSVNATGGTPPYTVRYSSTDPYVTACQCGIFSSHGNETVTAQVSDSADLESSVTEPVSIYLRLAAHLAANRTSGPAPLPVRFTDSAVTGGHGNPSAVEAATHWSFGDGENASGASVDHVYANPGYYVAIGSTVDAVGGVSSEAFLIDAYAPGPAPTTIVSANITPAINVPAGTLVDLSAHPSGTAGPYLVHWELGANDTAFGPFVQQSYAYAPCLATGLCPLAVGVEVENGTGGWTNLSIPLSPAVRGNASALVLSDSVGPSAGATPFDFHGVAVATGMPNATILWTFGDGSNSTGPAANHTFLAPGNYTVSVTATDPLGDRLVRTHGVVVIGVPRFAPVLTGGPNVTSGVAPLVVGFAAHASGGSGPPYTYSWNFGDGWRASGNLTSHIYASPGEYTANVTAVDGIGSPTTDSYDITVYNTTTVGFAVVGWNGTAAPSESLRIAVVVSPVCRPDSRPGCAANAVGFRAAILSAGAPPPAASSDLGAAGVANEHGWSNLTLTAPATPGAFVLYVWADEVGYVGTSYVALTVLAPPGPKAGPLTPAEELGIGVGVAVAVGLAVVAVVLLARRRRARTPSPSRPRGERGGPRGG